MTTPIPEQDSVQELGSASDTDAGSSSSNLNRIIGFAVVLALLAIAAFALPISEWLTALIEWIGANKGISWLVFIFVYIFATVLLLPGSLLTLSAGFLFGLPLGFVLVSAGSVIGACCAFLLGRYFARDWVAQKIAGNAKFNALDNAVRDKGFVIVLLTRLSPVFPFNLLNYALGITGVKFRSYALASWLGMIPGTVLFVYLGSAAQNLAEIFSGEAASGNNWLLYVGLVATLILTVLITRFATQALNTELEANS